MGFDRFVSAHDPQQELGKNQDAGSEAAAAANAASQRAIGELSRQFNLTREDLAPFLQAGLASLPGLLEGSTAEGLDARLGRVFDTDTFGELADERTRAVQGQLSAGGLTRSGQGLQEIANVPTSLGLGIEGLLTGRLQGLAGTGQNAAAGIGGIGQSNAQSIAQLLAGQGQSTASGILGDAQANAAQQQQLFGLATTAASVFFSDPALKENVEQISMIGDLTLNQWDWIDEAKGTMIEKCGTIGFMADEVQEKYPQHVTVYGGFLVIDYPALLEELEAA